MTPNNIAGDRLRSFVERVERLEEEKAALAADIREVFAEMKGAGFDTKTVKRIIKERKMDQGDRAEQDAIYQIYAAALGMTPMESYIAESTPALKVVGS